MNYGKYESQLDNAVLGGKIVQNLEGSPEFFSITKNRARSADSVIKCLVGVISSNGGIMTNMPRVRTVSEMSGSLPFDSFCARGNA